MQITTRDFLKRLGLGGAAVATGAAFADDYVPDRSRLPAGSCGDPQNAWFGKHIFPLEHTQTDGPSCFVRDGRVYEPAKEIPVFHATDVVVVGGGPAGFAAAVSAARAGSKVALVERYGSLGGLFTNGMVLIMLATSRKTDGKWELVARGICDEFMTRVGRFGRDFSSEPTSVCPRERWHPTVDPEAAKVLMDDMVAEQKNIEMFFHCWGVDVIQDGNKVLGVVFESKEGRQAILARQVVDCTGDADMLFKAGGDYRQITSGTSTVFRWANMDTIRPPQGSTAKWPDRGNEGNPDARWGGGTMMTANGLSVRDLTRVEIAQRRENWRKVMAMRATPGWEKVYTSNSASQIGIRGTRLIDAEFIMGRKEVFEKIPFDDCIGWCGHDGPHAAFPVSFRQLLPKKIDNLLCAGRCLGKGDTIDTFRLIVPCMMTGQAAGVAAALAAQKGVAPRALAFSAIAAALDRQGVYRTM
ncbi:MAG: FAD-dependent oxidoreductase [Kiritimatiellia bacterium]